MIQVVVKDHGERPADLHQEIGDSLRNKDIALAKPICRTKCRQKDFVESLGDKPIRVLIEHKGKIQGA